MSFLKTGAITERTKLTAYIAFILFLFLKTGAIAERTKLTAYIAFCLLNTVVYSFPAHWVWSKDGWLKKMHVVDVAGVGPVHLVGGVTALVAAIMVKPRYGRFSDDQVTVHGNSVNAVLGLFILW